MSTRLTRLTVGDRESTARVVKKLLYSSMVHYVSLGERKKGLTTSHLPTHLDPFAIQLMIISCLLFQYDVTKMHVCLEINLFVPYALLANPYDSNAR